jgi:hypothetical protein
MTRCQVERVVTGSRLSPEVSRAIVGIVELFPQLGGDDTILPGEDDRNRATVAFQIPGIVEVVPQEQSHREERVVVATDLGERSERSDKE